MPCTPAAWPQGKRDFNVACVAPRRPASSYSQDLPLGGPSPTQLCERSTVPSAGRAPLFFASHQRNRSSVSGGQVRPFRCGICQTGMAVYELLQRSAYQGGTRRTLADVCSLGFPFFPTRLMRAFSSIVSVLAPAGTTPPPPPATARSIVSIATVGLLWGRGCGEEPSPNKPLRLARGFSSPPCTA